MEVLNQLGIKPLLLLAQVINFLILLFLLKRFLYKPILKILENRKQKIENSMKQADEVAKELANAEKMKLEKEELAKKQAAKILDDSRKNAELTRQEIIAKSEEDAKRILEKTTKEIQGEKEKILKEVREQAVEFTTLATTQVLQKGIDEKRQQELIQEALTEIDKKL